MRMLHKYCCFQLFYHLKNILINLIVCYLYLYFMISITYDLTCRYDSLLIVYYSNFWPLSYNINIITYILTTYMNIIMNLFRLLISSNSTCRLHNITVAWRLKRVYMYIIACIYVDNGKSKIHAATILVCIL